MTDEAPTTEQPAPEPGPGQQPPPRRLLRTNEDRIIGGVAAGLGRTLGVDAWIVRLVFLLLTVFGGAGVVGYLVLLAFVPADAGDGTPQDQTYATTHPFAVGAAAVAGVAVLIAIDGGFGGWFFGGNLLLLLAIAGLAYAAYRGLERQGGRPPTAARVAGGVLLALAVLALVGTGITGAFWLAASGGGEVAAGIVIALGVVAAVSAFVRPVRWLAPAALVVAVPLALVIAADIDLDGGIGDRTYRPATGADVDPEYKLGMGELTLDLRETAWPRGGVLETRVDVGMGHALVLVPSGVCISAEGDVGVGAFSVLDEESGGIDVEQEVVTGTAGTRPRLRLHGTVGLGHLEVDTARRNRRGPDRHRDDDDDDRGTVRVSGEACPSA
ncbi:PspC domain-containing protein [Conexibacter sp. SYSU D00693]|uniref:PspC domain-containing protein n=1 Tax=Conexibacter sp. SYSU D00693 TaxID=2812560 RepID=UPI00196A2A09|nr:PspC domain-containing protein [Conexibacter sp. SYSU D00693]